MRRYDIKEDNDHLIEQVNYGDVGTGEFEWTILSRMFGNDKEQVKVIYGETTDNRNCRSYLIRLTDRRTPKRLTNIDDDGDDADDCRSLI